MKTDPTRTERRKHKRFHVKENVFAADSSRMGQIIDLSMGGLSFNYPEMDNAYEETQELDIFVNDNGFFLEDIPVMTISDTKMTDTVDQPMPVLRRRSVQFRELTQEQKFQLEYLLWVHHK